MAYLDDGGFVQFKNPIQSLPTGVVPCLAEPWFDFWSLGCMLYRALARKPLFEADDADNIYSKGEKKRLLDWAASDLDAALREVSVVLHSLEVALAQILAAVDVLAWMLNPMRAFVRIPAPNCVATNSFQLRVRALPHCCV